MQNGETKMSQKIDFVITWVDGNDPNWQEDRRKYIENSVGDARDIRFRDWNNLQYWFRGIEKFTPWVNKIHFVTWGHLPIWLNTNNPKLNIVRHEDFIPKEYLPTFSSHPIELNLHRIKGLSEQFVYFNDDMFIIKKMEKEEFFKDGLPRDYAVIMPLIVRFRNSISGIIANNMEVINTTFEKNEVIRKNLFKWINLRYKKQLFNTILNMPYKSFVGFYNPHLPHSYLKATFEEVWRAESEIMISTCSRKFRDRRDINHWLFRYWQLVSGNFKPISPDTGKYFTLSNNNQRIINAITEQKYKMICINDGDIESIVDFDRQKTLLQEAFSRILPEKSSFEL